jgi:hypothetical protein
VTDARHREVAGLIMSRMPSLKPSHVIILRLEGSLDGGETHLMPLLEGRGVPEVLEAAPLTF